MVQSSFYLTGFQWLFRKENELPGFPVHPFLLGLLSPKFSPAALSGCQGSKYNQGEAALPNTWHPVLSSSPLPWVCSWHHRTPGPLEWGGMENEPHGSALLCVSHPLSVPRVVLPQPLASRAFPGTSLLLLFSWSWEYLGNLPVLSSQPSSLLLLFPGLLMAAEALRDCSGMLQDAHRGRKVPISVAWCIPPQGGIRCCAGIGAFPGQTARRVERQSPGAAAFPEEGMTMDSV